MRSATPGRTTLKPNSSTRTGCSGCEFGMTDKGIAPAILEEGRPGHYGLPGMRERARQIGAKLTIWSGVGAGTEIELSLEGSIAYGTPPGRSRLRLFRKKAG